MNEKEKQEILDYYCSNEMQQLKKICYYKMKKIHISPMEYDDLYSIALDVLRASVESYKPDYQCKFTSFLSNNIERNFYKYLRYKNQAKRKCKLVYLDSDDRYGISLYERVMIEKKSEDSSEEKVEMFMQSLSDVQRKILKLKMEDVPVNIIKKILHLTNSEYTDEMQAIKENKLMCLFNKNRREII